MEYAIAVIVLVVAAALLLRSSRTTTAKSDLTGKTYVVLRRPDAQLAADTLARLEIHLFEFLDKAERMFPNDRRLQNVRTRWSGTLSEIAGRGSQIAYSSSKRDVSVCIRNERGAIDDLKTCKFVLFHELAHVANDEWGHGQSFWDDFKFILEAAEAVGSYAYENFDDAPKTYCGLKITSSPLTCVKKKACKSALQKETFLTPSSLQNGPLRPNPDM